MKKVLIVGSKGMLGTDLVEALSSHIDYTPVGLSRQDLNITQLDSVQKAVVNVSPDIVINCAAYTDVDGAEDHSDEAYQVNAYGAEYLARATKELGIPLVHISTNFVFDGLQDTPYTEDQEPTQPLNIYGSSKLRGEEFVQKYNDKTYIIRTSNLFGRHGKNFVQTMVRLGQSKDSIQVVSDQIGNPTYTNHLAQAIIDILQDEPAFGVYHLTNSTPAEAGISWYSFAKKIMEIRGYPTKITRISSESYPSKATRPHQGTLLNTKRPKLPSYQQALQEFLAENS